MTHCVFFNRVNNSSKSERNLFLITPIATYVYFLMNTNRINVNYNNIRGCGWPETSYALLGFGFIIYILKLYTRVLSCIILYK